MKIVIVSAASLLLLGCGNHGDATFTLKGSANRPSSAITRLGSIGIPQLQGGTVIGDPASLTIKMYSLYVSANEDCSSPVLVTDHGSSGAEKDFSAGPTLFEGTPANGTYKCLIVNMSDWLKFKSNSVGPLCNLTTEYDMDIYRDGTATDSETWTSKS